ncbi:MAG: hypothetical protein ACLTK0_07245 [Anaerovoracaceae bacterium]
MGHFVKRRSKNVYKDLRRELGKKELFGIACGNIIGSGIMILVFPV